MKKLLLFVVLLFGLTLGLSGCGSSSSGGKTLRVGMDAAYPPFGFQNMETKSYEGFDVDIIKAIAKEEGLEADIHNVNFDGLIPALQSGDLDTAINDITVTEDRKKSVDFTKPYYIAGLGVVVKGDDSTIRSKEDLKGKTPWRYHRFHRGRGSPQNRRSQCKSLQYPERRIPGPETGGRRCRGE